MVAPGVVSLPRGLRAPRSTRRARNCRAEAAALLATGCGQPKAGARPGDGQSLKRPAALSALPLNWLAAEPGAGLDTIPGGWLAGVDDDKAARDLIEIFWTASTLASSTIELRSISAMDRPGRSAPYGTNAT